MVLAADVNLIPLSPVMKVDVLKDGASAIYGSDAVAGVINFQMWNDIRDYGPIYEGAEVEVPLWNYDGPRCESASGVDSRRCHRHGWQGIHLCRG